VAWGSLLDQQLVIAGESVVNVPALASRVRVLAPEMREQLPLVMAGLSRVAALSPAAFQSFNPLVVEMFDVDASVGRAVSATDEAPDVPRAISNASRTSWELWAG
jgi:hypothetical protein